MNDNELTELIIGCAIRVHRQLGPGLLESVYEECLVHELCKAGLSVERQPIMPVVYDGLRMDSGYRVDIWVEKRIIIELKAVELLTDVHFAQLMTYLRLANCRLGLLINFNVVLLKNGIKRVANGY
ncbi:GxxExxY protein [Spirosoma oryzae]|uniref:GxxExxY protein n=1 Tax=Spirosoma oryzae TaxID=1469603 RepID=A0A2T0S6P5_9BACT|nr:GxxExxY protein [Spirosoma oryzae]PRY29101.1 GxxExxY protein [Spirosoma oryzae]